MFYIVGTMFYIVGIEIKWILEPPDLSKFGAEFNATAELILTREFYEWGFQQDIFTGIKGSVGAK
jgi:hypothetical protein